MAIAALVYLFDGGQEMAGATWTLIIISFGSAEDGRRIFVSHLSRPVLRFIASRGFTVSITSGWLFNLRSDLHQFLMHLFFEFFFT